MPAERDRPLSTMLPPSLQWQLKENLFTTKVQPAFTELVVASGGGTDQVFVLSGTNLEGRVGMLIQNSTAYDAGQSLQIGFSESDVGPDFDGFSVRGRDIVQPSSPDASIWLPLGGGVSGSLAFCAATGGDQTLKIIEW